MLPAPRPFLAVVASLLLVALLALSWLRLAGIAPLPADAPATQFSATRALRELEDVLGEHRDSPRPVGSVANHDVATRIAQRLESLGFETHHDVRLHCDEDGSCAWLENVAASRRGSEPRAGFVVLACHHDSVAAGPGIADDGSGVAILLETARALAASPPLRSGVVLLADDGEELGLLGAELFCATPPWPKDIRGVVNVEARGTSGPSALFETSAGNLELVRAVMPHLERPVTSSLFYSAYQRLPNDTDLTVFKKQGWPGVNFAFAEGVARYHASRDDLAHLSLESLQHQGTNALAALRVLAETELPHGHEDATFFDVLALGVVWWPERASPFLGAAAAILVALAGALALRRGLVRDRQVLLAEVAVLAVPLVAGTLAFAVVSLVGVARGPLASWTAHPGPLIATSWLAAAALALAAAVAVARRAGPWNLWLGVWLAWAVGAGLAGNWLRAECFALIVPALVAGVAGLLALGLPGLSESTRLRIAVLVPAVAALVLWLPLQRAALLLVGLDLPPAAVVPLAVALTTLMPAWGELREARPWRLVAALGTLAAAAAVAALLVPAFSTDAPRTLNFVVHEDADSGATELQARGGAVPPPAEVLAVTGTDAEWSLAQGRATLELPPLGAAPPELELLRDERTESGRELTCRLRSARRAPVARVEVPAASHFAAMTVAGTRMPARPDALRGGPEAPHVFRFDGLPAEGVELTLSFAQDEPVELRVEDMTPGLPESARAFAAARPAWCAQRQEGDRTIVTREVRIPAHGT